MEVRLLGHLEVEFSGELVRFERAKQRRLFAMLALRAPDALTADRPGPGPPWESVTAMQDRALADARHALGDRYASHFPEGRRLSAEDAVARLQTGSADLAETSSR